MPFPLRWVLSDMAGKHPFFPQSRLRMVMAG
jgi:hypothetical protein